jgi:putative phage-type endonuclease
VILELAERQARVLDAVPVTTWEATETEWLQDRRSGLGGSDVSAALGFSRYTSAWEVWREKTSRSDINTESPSEAAALGTALEPWLVEQASEILGVPVYRSAHRTYAHPDHAWRRCSPDGIVADGRIVEAKTAGLASGFGTPPGWSDGGVPLGYEFQVRWSMHVMDAPAAEIIALVAGMGIVHRTIDRDAAIEATLVAQLQAWWTRHIVHDQEPAFGAGDAAILAELYPTVEQESVELDDTDALGHWEIYLAAREREAAAKAEKEAAGAALKQLLGGAGKGTVEGNTIVTWPEVKGKVQYTRLLADLTPALEAAGIAIPNPENYRGAPSRSLKVKDLSS